MNPIAILAEQWLAAMGITVFLAGGKVRLDRSVELKVQTMESDVRATFERFSSKRKFAKQADDPEFARSLSFEKLADDLYEPADPDELQSRLEGFPADLMPELALAASRTLMWLRSLLPPVRHETFAGLKYRDPSPRDKEAYLRAFDVADDPTSVLRELEAGTLSGDQADALGACFPELYGYWQTLALESLTESELPLAKEKQLRLFMAATAISFDVSAVVQTMAAEATEEGQPQSGGGKPSDLGIDFYGSNADKLAAR